MTVVAIEGFDSYNTTGVSPGMQARWLATSSAFAMSTGRFAGQAFRCNNAASPGSMALNLPASYAAVTVGYAFRTVSLPGSTGVVGAAAFDMMLWATSGTISQFGIRANPNGAIEVFRATSATAGTLLGTSANGVIVANTWHYIEVELAISDTVGTVTVYVDSVSVLALTGQDTRNGVPTTVDQLRIGHFGTFSGLGLRDFDDIYVTDSAAKLGERRVETLYPSADVVGATDWTQSTGANRFGTVDEATVDTTDYISATTVGNVERFTHAGLSSTPTSIDAVQVVGYGLKTDATARSVALQVKSGATTSDGANFSLATTVTQIRRDLLLTDPATAAAWAAAAVNALEFGVKVTV